MYLFKSRSVLSLALLVGLTSWVARSAGSKLSLSCAGSNINGIWRYVCTKTSGDNDSVIKTDASGTIAVLGLGPTSGDVTVVGALSDKPHSAVRKNSTGELEVVDASGRVTFSQFLPKDAPPLSPFMPSVVIVGDLPATSPDLVSIDLRSSSADMSGGRAVYVGNAPKIQIDVSGKTGKDGRDAGVAVAMQVASGAFGSGGTAQGLISQMNITSSLSEPSLEWSALSSLASKCENVGLGFKTPVTNDGGVSFNIGVEKAKEQVATRNICERLTSQEVAVQSTCVRPGEVASTVSCSYPDISQKVGLYSRATEEKNVSFSCSAQDLTGVWKTSCSSKQTAIVTAAIRPDYTVMSPSQDLVVGMRIPLRHNFPSWNTVCLDPFKADYAKIITTPDAQTGFSITSQDISAGPVNIYMKSAEFSSFPTPSYSAFFGQQQGSSLITSSGGGVTKDDCGLGVTKLDKVAMLGGLIDRVETTVVPGSIGDRDLKIRKVTNLGYWAGQGTKGGEEGTKPERLATDAISGIAVSAKASDHDARYTANANSEGRAATNSGRIESELADLGFLPISSQGAVVSYDKLTVTRSLTAKNDSSFEQAITPMIGSSGEAIRDGNNQIVTNAMNAFKARLTAAGSTNSLLGTEFREKIVYAFENLRMGLATKRGSGSLESSIVYRALTNDVISLPPKAIYLPGDFAAKPITISKYCDSINIDDQENFFTNGDSVTLGGLEMPNGQRLNMRSSVSESNQESDTASDHEQRETPNNIFSGWGMSFLKLNKIPLKLKNENCTKNNSVTIEHRISRAQKNILNSIKNSTGVLLIAYGNTITVYFSPAKSPKSPDVQLMINTGISDGMYMPRINVSPLTLGHPIPSAGNTALAALTNGTQIKPTSLNYEMIGSNTDYSMKADFEHSLEYYDVPFYPDSSRSQTRRPFVLESTRSLSSDLVNSSASDPAGEFGSPVSAAKYVKSLRVMSLAAAKINPQSSGTTVSLTNDGGITYDEKGNAIAMLASHIGTIGGGVSPVKYCTSESMIDEFNFPTKLISRRAIKGGNNINDLDMNVTSNEEVSGPTGPINSHNRRIGYFSRAFLPTTLTYNMDNYLKNRSDPYHTARDYNAYLADLQKYSNLEVSTTETAPKTYQFTVKTKTLFESPAIDPDTRLEIGSKPYDLGLDFRAATSRFSQLAGVDVLAGAEILSGTNVINDPAVMRCLRSASSTTECLAGEFAVGALSSLLVPFSIVTGQTPQLCNSATCPLIPETFSTSPAWLMSSESSVYRPRNLANSGWYNFWRCALSGNDTTSLSLCDDTFGVQTIIRRGFKRFPLESSELAFTRLGSTICNESDCEDVVNKPYFNGMLAPLATSDTVVFTTFPGAITRKSDAALVKISPPLASSVGSELPSSASLSEDNKNAMERLGYDDTRRRLLGGPLDSSSGGAEYFEGTFGLPLLGGPNKLWLEWFETGSMKVEKSERILAYYDIIDSDKQTKVGESDPAVYSRVIAGITPYAGPEALAVSANCDITRPIGSKECMAASRLEKNAPPAFTNGSGGASVIPLKRQGMSAYMFSGCSDNLSSIIRPNDDQTLSNKHVFSANDGEGSHINYSLTSSYKLYLPFAIRAWKGAYFGPVHGVNMEPLVSDGIKYNALAVEDRSATGRQTAGVDVYVASYQKTVSEAPFGNTPITLYDGEVVGGPTSITLDYAVSEAKRIISNPAYSGSTAYESPLVLSPEVLLGLFAHENLGDEESSNSALDGKPVGSQLTSGTAVLLVDVVSKLSSLAVNSVISTNGFSINKLAVGSGSGLGIILSPKTTQSSQPPRVRFSWVVSNDSLLATVISPGVANGSQSSSETSVLSGGVVNGVAGGVAVDFNSVLGSESDQREFVSAITGLPITISRFSGLDPAILAGAGFTVRPMPTIPGITAKLTTLIDGQNRVRLGDAAPSGGSAFFLADELCGERKFMDKSSDSTRSDQIQNTIQNISYCESAPDYTTEKDCTTASKVWHYGPVKGSPTSERINPYGNICSYAATRGRQTAADVASRWLETANDRPSLVLGECEPKDASNAIKTCSIDRLNSANNVYWETQSVDTVYGFDAFGDSSGAIPITESIDPVVPTVCPSGSSLRAQQFISTSNANLLTFTALNNFAGANFEASKAVCPFACTVSSIATEDQCTTPSLRPSGSVQAVGQWRRTKKIASVDVSLFSDKDLCYSEQSGSSVRDMRTEADKISGGLICKGTYDKCSLPGRFNRQVCESPNLPGGAGVWTTSAPVDSSFKPSAVYGTPSPFMSSLQSVASAGLTPRQGQFYEPYSILSGSVDINRRSAEALGVVTVLRGGEGETDSLGYKWVKESVYARPLCQNIFYTTNDGFSASSAQSGALGVLLPTNSSVDERRRYGSIDPFIVVTKARQINIEGGAGTNISAYADACNFDTVEATTSIPMPRPGVDPSLNGSTLNIHDFTRRSGIDYIKGEAVSVTKIQPTPWSTEVADGNGFTAPNCDIFDDPTIAAREGSVSVGSGDLPSDFSFRIGDSSAPINRSSLYRANPITQLDSSSSNTPSVFSYGGTWHKTGEERLELTRLNSTTIINCRIFSDSSSGNDSCEAPITTSVEVVDGVTFNIIAENGENGGAAGSAVVLTTTKPQSVSIKSLGGLGGAAGGTTISGQPNQGNTVCYSTGQDPLTPHLRLYKYRQNAAVVKPGSGGQSGPGGGSRGQDWWGVMPDARKWLQKKLQN